MKNFIILSLTLLLAGSCSTSIPAPDLKKGNESLLIIPSSVNYKNTTKNSLNWSIKFKNIRSNEVNLVKFNAEPGKEFIVTDSLLPGNYVAEEFLHPEHGMDFIIKASVVIQKGNDLNDLSESKRLGISSIPINVENKKINIPNFKFVYFEEGSGNECCFYYGFLKEITSEERSSFISKIRNIENFDKWGLGVEN